jgi:hypothetical protein
MHEGPPLAIPSSALTLVRKTTVDPCRWSLGPALAPTWVYRHSKAYRLPSMGRPPLSTWFDGSGRGSTRLVTATVATGDSPGLSPFPVPRSTLPPAVNMCAGKDYADAWQSQRGVCHRFMYYEDDKPTEWLRPVLATGWRDTWDDFWGTASTPASSTPTSAGLGSPAEGSRRRSHQARGRRLAVYRR